MIPLPHQLTQTTIHAEDFQDNVYHFPVDSVLATESAPGKLVISISEGYMLTTTSAGQPKREQSLTYKKQSDGQWAVHSVVTIMASEKDFPDGSVRIHNAQAGTTVLTIQGESTALARIPETSLIVSETALSFGQTAPGQSRSLVFSISQPYTDELVLITSDAPEYFLLATDKHPNFTASLQVKSSLIGTYVHVRYLAKKVGSHSGQLHIQGASDEQIIPLSGRTTRFLPAVRSARSLNAYAQSERQRPSLWLKMGLTVAALAVVCSMAWFGFMNRQTISSDNPVLNEKMEAVTPDVVKADRVEKAPRTSGKSLNEAREGSRKVRSVVAKANSVKKVTAESVDNVNSKVESQTVEPRPKDRKEPAAKSTEPLVTKRPYQQARPVPAVGESELEKELNQSTPNQP